MNIGGWVAILDGPWQYVNVNTITNSQDGTPGGRKPRVVVIGAGFGGLRAARKLRGAGVDVLLIDRNNFHQFLPLLYEVAAAGLEPDDIAQPVRAIVRRDGDIRFLMAEVRSIDLDRRLVVTDAAEIAYDYLVVAAGSVTNYFGLASVEERALGLKDIGEATAVRNRILRAFEAAVVADDAAERARLMTVVIVGGGPTGVELAGALAELKCHVLPRDYPDLDLTQARVVLLEATDRVVGAMPEKLQREAVRQLEQLGAEVRLNAAVAEASDHGVVLRDGSVIPAATLVWVAGVRGEPLGERLGVPAGPGGRIRVELTLQVPGHPEAYVIGDLAYLEAPDGLAYPMVAPVAMQQGELAAANIRRALAGERQQPFRYRDRGTMATIGRRKAVAKVFGLQLTGFIAWSMWLVVHLLQLVGLRNRVLVLVNWAWNYVRYDRANRLVTDGVNRTPPESASNSPPEA